MVSNRRIHDHDEVWQDDESEGHESSTPPRRTPIILTGILSAVTVFIAAAIGGVMWLQGQWTGPSSSDPKTTVDDFLTALLTDHDRKEAAKYTCSSLANDFDGALDIVDALEANGRTGKPATFSWDDVKQSSSTDAGAIVTADVSLDLTGESTTWTFAMVTGDPDDAWRVCSVDTGAPK